MEDDPKILAERRVRLHWVVAMSVNEAHPFFSSSTRTMWLSGVSIGWNSEEAFFTLRPKSHREALLRQRGGGGGVDIFVYLNVTATRSLVSIEESVSLLPSTSSPLRSWGRRESLLPSFDIRLNSIPKSSIGSCFWQRGLTREFISLFKPTFYPCTVFRLLRPIPEGALSCR